MTQAFKSVQGLCGGCGTPNGPEDRFCAGCGQTLWEKCPNCNRQSQIGQKFCNQCGHDLQQSFQERLEARQDRLDRAAPLAEKGKYTEAIAIAQLVTEAEDFRFREIAAKAQSLITQWKQELEAWQAKVASLPSQLDVLEKRRDYRALAQLLEPVPAALLNEDQKRFLSEAQRALERAEASRENLKAALQQKNWETALSELASLLEVFPGQKSYVDLLEQVIAKVDKQVAELIRGGKHAQALMALNSIPLPYQTEKHAVQRTTLEELISVRRIVASAPSASAFVGSAIDRLEKLTPQDSVIASLRERFAVARKTPPEKPYWLYPKWRPGKSGTFEGSILPATLPRNVAGARPDCLVKAGARFWTALGLALHALNSGEPTADFTRESRGGIWDLFGKRKSASNVAWGVDLGRSGIKAVKLGGTADGFRIEEAVLFPMDSADQGEPGRATTAAIYRHFEKVLKDPLFGDTPVVCSMPACDLLARYVELPTQSKSQHQTFINQEAQANIPIPFDALATSYSICPAYSESSVSQLAMLFALRKTDVEARAAVFNRLKINLVGIIPEPIAHRHTMQALDYLGEVPEGTRSAILLIDVGTVGTSVHVMMRHGSWFRHIDWGVNNLAKAVASKFKITQAEADKLRRNMAASKSMSEVAECLSDACAVPKRELDRSLRAARDQLGEFDITAPILMGGGAYQPLLGSMLNGESS